MRLAETEGPQRIGKRSSFVVVPERVWEGHAPPQRMPMGRWLVENMPRGTNLEIPARGGESRREIPFVDWNDEDLGAGDKVPARHQRGVRDDQERTEPVGPGLSERVRRSVAGVQGGARVGIRTAAHAAGTTSKKSCTVSSGATRTASYRLTGPVQCGRHDSGLTRCVAVVPATLPV